MTTLACGCEEVRPCRKCGAPAQLVRHETTAMIVHARYHCITCNMYSEHMSSGPLISLLGTTA